MSKFFQDLLLTTTGILITAFFSFFSSHNSDKSNEEGYAISAVDKYWKRIDAQSEKIGAQSAEIRKQSDQIQNITHLLKEAREENTRLTKQVRQLTTKNIRLTNQVKKLSQEINEFTKGDQQNGKGHQ